jgi:hypothetical protein
MKIAFRFAADVRDRRGWILGASAFNGLLVTVASAAVVACVTALEGFARHSGPGLLDLLETTALLCPIMAPYGVFAVAASIVGATVICSRRRSIRSMARLLGESAICGFLLSCLLPLIDASMSGPERFLCVPFGTTCAIICAIVFRKQFFTGAIQE